MDIVDEAQALNEMILESTLRNKRTNVIPFSGFCLACEEPVDDRRFCDSYCRENHEKSQRHQKIMGLMA